LSWSGSHGFRGVVPGEQREFFDSSPRLKPSRIFKQKQVSSQEPRASPGQEVHRLLREGRTLPHRGRRSSGEDGQRQEPVDDASDRPVGSWTGASAAARTASSNE
jgi:hypothetical protein